MCDMHGNCDCTDQRGIKTRATKKIHVEMKIESCSQRMDGLVREIIQGENYATRDMQNNSKIRRI